MSFFDEDDEPTRKGIRPRPRRGAATPRPAAAPDAHTARTRQAALIGIGLLFVFLLVLAVKGCADSSHEGGLKDYNREHTAIVDESDGQVAQPFFDLLGQVTGNAGNDLAAQVQSLRVTADQQLQQAQRLSVPDEMVPAQRSLLIALEMRRNALQYIGTELPGALADNAEAAGKAVERIAGQMEVLLASDVLHETRVVPLIEHALSKAGIGDQKIRRSSFLSHGKAGLAWLDPAFVGQRLNPAAGAGPRRQAATCPSVCGTGLDSVAVGSKTLATGAATVNRIASKPGLTFDVKFTNGGQVDEFEVKVHVTIAPQGGKPIKVSRTVGSIAAGKQATASLQFTKLPPAGVPATIEVVIDPVPGEKKLDNNKQTYTALFTK